MIRVIPVGHNRSFQQSPKPRCTKYFYPARYSKTGKNTEVQFGKYISQTRPLLCGNRRAGRAPTRSGPTAPAVDTVTSQKRGRQSSQESQGEQTFPWNTNLHSKIRVKATHHYTSTYTQPQGLQVQVQGTGYNTRLCFIG